MLTINNDCTQFTYTGLGILTDEDLSNVSKYTIDMSHNEINYSQNIEVNVIDGAEDTYTLPCGVTKVVECSDLTECTCTPVTEDILGDVDTEFSEPTITGSGWKNNYKEEVIELELSQNSSFKSLTINNIFIILTTTNNNKYSASYANLDSGDSPSSNAKKLEEDLQLAFLASSFKAKVNVFFDNTKQNFKIRIEFLQIIPTSTSMTIDVNEYLFSTSTTNILSQVVSPNIKSYTRDRFYLLINNYDDTNTRHAYWSLEDEGSIVSTIKTNTDYIIFFKDLAATGNFVVWYNVVTLQGKLVRYKYVVNAISNTNITMNTTFAGCYEEDGTTPTVQVSTSYGTGEVIGSTITACTSNTNLNENCITYWEIDSQFFQCGNTSQLNDGVYNLTITIEYDDGTCKIYSECIFVGCVIKCRLLEFLAENKHRVDLVAIYQALTITENCSFSCAELYELYEYLNEQLNNGNSTTTTNCGCM